MADLVEYCYGNASTTWGSLRIQDGHPAPYKLRFVELGNEQYNTFYSEQAAAMEKRAIDLGVGGQFNDLLGCFLGCFLYILFYEKKKEHQLSVSPAN